MASLRRLKLQEYCSVLRSRSKNQAANHHYWSLRSDRFFDKRTIYRRDGYRNRWSFQYRIPHTRFCGLWNRPSRDSLPNEQMKQEVDKSRLEEHPSEEMNQQSSGRPEADRFFHMLRNNAPIMYRLFQQEFDKDRHEWVFDPEEAGSVWNSIELGDNPKYIYSPEQSSPSSVNKEDTSVKEQQAMMPKAEEFIIDPITCRKVPIARTSNENTLPDDVFPVYQPTSNGNMNGIPVKKYRETARRDFKSSKQSISTNNQPDLRSGDSPQRRTWLIKEGFTMGIDKSSILHESSVNIQPSLDRLVSKRSEPNASLQYPPRDVTTDDVDLLRASDIRAASGHVKVRPGLSDRETKSRLKALEKDWNQTEKTWSRDVTNIYYEIGEKRRLYSDQKCHDDVPTELSKSSNLEDFRKVKQYHDKLQHDIKMTIPLLEKARNDVLQDSLAEEAKLMKQNFDSFEERCRNHMTAANDGQYTVPKTDGHSVSKRVSVIKEEKSGRLNQDSELAKQIRAIYEEKYGEIGIDHKQDNTMAKEIDGKQSKETTNSALYTTPSTISLGTSQEFSSSSIETDNSKAGSSHPNDTSVRDLLYQSIENLNLPVGNQKRLKFALRGIPELDAKVPTPSSIPDGLLDSTTVSKNTSIPAPIRTEISPKASMSSKSTTPSTDRPKSATNETKSSHSTKHHNRPANLDNSQNKKHEEITFIYKILALDTKSNEVAVATTTSSIKHKSSVPRSAAGVLVHLNQPAKYFSHIERLDAKGFQLVSGSRTMLVYRRKISTDGTPDKPVVNESKFAGSSRAMNPLREEPVFSGHLHPKARLLRSRQLAHRRTESGAAKKSSETVSDSITNVSSQASVTSNDQPAKTKTFRNLAGTLITITLAVTLCYTIGLVQDMRVRKEHDKNMQMMKAEAKARKLDAQKNDWRWL